MRIRYKYLILLNYLQFVFTIEISWTTIVGRAPTPQSPRRVDPGGTIGAGCARRAHPLAPMTSNARSDSCRALPMAPRAAGRSPNEDI